MPSAVTNDQITKLRSRGHWGELYAAFLIPQVIYSARLASLPSSFDMVAEITYTSGSGTLGNVREGMTLYVGTSAGAYDLGMVRIRKTPIAGTFYISEQSRVAWEASAYLTVVADYDLWAKHVRVDGTTAKMDYDIAYSDQHTNFTPVPVLGSHRVAKLTGATIGVTLGPPTGIASWVFGSTITAYSWTVPGAVSLSSSTAVRPVATFNAVGWYPCYCTVTAANGKTKTGIRWVYIWDDDHKPATVFELRDLREDYLTGGTSGTLVLADEASLTEVRERSLCVLFSTDYIDNDAVVMGQLEHCENIRFVGRVGDEGFEYDADAGTVTLDIQGAQYWFSKIQAFPSGIEIAKNTPTAWTSLPELTVDRGLWHLLEWRSTATAIMDVLLTGDARYSPEVFAYDGNLWEQMEEYAYNQIRANIHIDHFGRLFAELDPQIIPESNRSSIVTIMTLTKQDLESGIALEKQVIPDTSMVDLSGIYINQYGGSPSSFFSLSPGHVFGDYGAVEVVDRMLVASQAQCNQIAGLLYGWKSNPYVNMQIKLVGNNKMVSCFPNQYIAFEVEAGDTPRGESVSGRWIPRGRSLDFDNKTGAWSVSLELEAESFEENSILYIPPSGNDISIPPLPSFPPLPTYPVPLPGNPSSTPDGPAIVVMIDKLKGVLYTTNFHEASPIWQFWNTGLPTDRLYSFGVWGDCTMFTTPSGACYIGMRYVGAAYNVFESIWYAPSLGAMWTEVVNQDWFDANVPGATGDFWGLSMGFNPNKPNEVAFAVRDNGVYTAHFYIGNNAGFVHKLSFSAGNFFGNLRDIGSLTFGMNKWVSDMGTSSGLNTMYRFSADGTTLEHVTDGFGNGAGRHSRAGTSATIIKAITNVNNANDIAITTDNADNITLIDLGQNLVSVRVSPDGLFMVGDYSAAGNRGKSSDGGYTWSGLPNLPFGGNYHFAYAGGAGVNSRWIAARGIIRYSNNVFGAEQWQNKEGNIIYLIPTGLEITYVYVPGYHNG